MVIIFDKHNLNIGNLIVKREYFLADEDFEDGVYRKLSVEFAHIELIDGASDVNETLVEVIPGYMQGEAGHTPYIGDNGNWWINGEDTGFLASPGQIVDRGVWDANEDYYCNSINPETGSYETSDAWYFGCRFRCARNKTQEPPKWNSNDWKMIEGDPSFSVKFQETDRIFDPDNFEVTLEIIAKLYNQNVTDDILERNVVWSRYSEDENGSERVESDKAWALKRSDEGKSIFLTTEDCDFNGYTPAALRFTATVTIADGISDAATFGY